MAETPIMLPADDTGADPATPAPSQAAGAATPPPAQPLEPSGSLPITPPLSPRLESDSKASLDTAGSRRSTRSHQEYLDSLQPPSEKEFGRLAKVQEEREQEHKRRNRTLLDQTAHFAQQSSVAQLEFVRAKHHHGLHSLLGHARKDSHGRAMAAEQAGSDSDNVQRKAAMLIQRNYRGYRVRREMKGLGLDANTRWTHAIRDAQWKRLNTPRSRGNSMLSPGSTAVQDESSNDASRPQSSQSAARQNWRKVATIARRAGGDQDSSHSDDDDDEDDSLSDGGANSRMSAEQRAALRERRASLRAKRRKQAKTMGLQYFLEMVDLKHRYGSNLRQYHEEWKRADTNENYFYWLDYGEGRNIELASCPRDRLDRERVRYLSREERQHYLVKVDAQGRLCWAKNGVRIDTTEQWKDSINGIVPVDDETPAFAPEIEAHSQEQQDAPRPRYQRPNHDDSSSDVSSDASESELEAARAAKYATPSLDDAKGLKKVKHVSAATIFNKLLRKSVKKNTWIFVADTSFRLYVGIKSSGSFQHSSFLQGSRISAAGLIKIKNGRLSSLSPLSGHYRPPASNFRAFVHSLKDEGVDMSHVSISKSYAVLVGLEAYVKTRKKGKETLQKMTHHKQKLLDPEEALKREEAAKDKSQSAELERRHLEKQDTARENRPGFRFLQRLGLRPRAPSIQKHPGGG